jgi:hypothetical protein
LLFLKGKFDRNGQVGEVGHRVAGVEDLAQSLGNGRLQLDQEHYALGGGGPVLRIGEPV